jgi:hypothetical protein
LRVRSYSSRTDTTPGPVVPVPVVVVIVAIIVAAGMRAYPAMAGLKSMRADADAVDMVPTLVVRCSGCQQLQSETILVKWHACSLVRRGHVKPVICLQQRKSLRCHHRCRWRRCPAKPVLAGIFSVNHPMLHPVIFRGWLFHFGNVRIHRVDDRVDLPAFGCIHQLPSLAAAVIELALVEIDEVEIDRGDIAIGVNLHI